MPHSNLLINIEEVTTTRLRAKANRGEIHRDESHAADPVLDATTMAITHRGGLVSSRTELY